MTTNGIHLTIPPLTVQLTVATSIFNSRSRGMYSFSIDGRGGDHQVMSKRGLRLRDAFSPLEPKSNHVHLCDAFGVVQNVIRRYSDKLWPDGAKECDKWNSICNDLIDLTNGVSHREEDRSFEDVLRDLIHVFQHGEARIAELLDSNSITIPEEEITQHDEAIFQWMDRVFRALVYGAINSRLPDKQDSTLVRITLFMDGSPSKEVFEHTPMPKPPRRYRKKYM